MSKPLHKEFYLTDDVPYNLLQAAWQDWERSIRGKGKYMTFSEGLVETNLSFEELKGLCRFAMVPYRELDVLQLTDEQKRG